MYLLFKDGNPAFFYNNKKNGKTNIKYFFDVIVFFDIFRVSFFWGGGGGGTGGNLPVRDMWICILPKSVRSSLQPSINFSVFLPTSRPEYKCFFLGFFEVKKGFFGLSRLPRVISINI